MRQGVRDVAEARDAHMAALAQARAACLLTAEAAELARALTGALQAVVDLRSALSAQRWAVLMHVLGSMASRRQHILQQRNLVLCVHSCHALAYPYLHIASCW